MKKLAESFSLVEVMETDFSGWVGRSVVRHDVVTERVVAQYKATLAPHLFEAACPPGLHWCLALAAHDETRLGPDGAEAKGLFLPPVALPRRMWAGGRIESLRPLAPGDAITRISRVDDAQWRQGKAGPMCIVSVVHEIEAAGALAVRERHDILFRGGGVGGGGTPRALPTPELEWRIDATPTLLFRFSAVTFNGHRIHYDLPYARDVEGYHGLLVHGPLQAALTLNMCAVMAGEMPRDFRYRCVAPLTAGQEMRVVGWRDGGALRAAVTDARGVATMEAEVMS